MPFVNCPLCGAQNKYPDDPRLRGQKMACTSCNSQIMIPKTAAASPPAQAPRPIPLVPVPPPRPGEKPFEVPNEPDPVPPSPVQPRPIAPRPAPPPVPAAASPQGAGPLPYLMLAPAWAGALLALPLGLKLTLPVLAIVLASVGLGTGLLSLLFALLRGRVGKAWGIASLTAVLAAASALVASMSVPQQEPKKTVTADEPIGSTYLPADTWVMPTATKHPLTASILSVHPGHIVVLVGEVGTDRVEVGKLLAGLFPDRVTEIPRNEAGRQKLLDEQLKKSIASISDPAAVLNVLKEMVAADVRFKGYVPGDAKVTFEIMIRRGGVFTLGASREASTQSHGALLHAKGIDQLAAFTGVKDVESLKRLSVLRDAIRDYSSLFDALAVAGNRPAYLVSVEPNRDAHEKAFETLLTHAGKPVFVPRPPPRLFDAVDPADVGGAGRGDYELQLPVAFYWRQVGKDDRDGADVNKLPPEAKWSRFDANGKVTWMQLTVENNRGAPLVASFDVAVQLSGQVVLFRNQNLYLHEKRDVVDTLTKNAAARMKITVAQGDDVASIQQGKGAKDPFVGTLNYAALANSFADKKMTNNVTVSMLSNAEFAVLRKTEGER